MKILITGARGQLGTDCAEVLSAHTLKKLDLPEIDIANPESVEAAFRDFPPDVVVNCAAWTAVDAAESAEEAAFHVNATGPAVLAEACRKSGALLIHISTDYVLSGDMPIPQAADESAVPAPRSAYGRTKLSGEQAILDSGCEAVILRTAWLYGAHGRNFPKTMLKLALARPDDTAHVVDDQWGCPTWSMRLARQIKKIVETPPQKRPLGVCHAVACGFTNWAEFAEEFLTLVGIPHKITPCTTAEFGSAAKRPANSILDDRRLRDAGILTMDDWRDALAEFVKKNRDDLLLEAATATLETSIGYTFKNKALPSAALNHPSWVCEHPGAESNQRLEFLGDAVVGVFLAMRLYAKFPGAPEGQLTPMRARLASGEALAAKASALGLGRLLRLGRGEKAGGGSEKRHNLADVMEAVVGALWLDGGAEATWDVLDRIFGDSLDAVVPSPPGAESPKSALQVLAARRNMEPSYDVIDRRGPDSNTVFTVEVTLGDMSACGQGRSKKAAESAAAALLLKKLQSK